MVLGVNALLSPRAVFARVFCGLQTMWQASVKIITLTFAVV